jgi:hypothetical protein
MIKQLATGQLLITAGNDTRRFIADQMKKGRSNDDIWADLLEHTRRNGSYEHFNNNWEGFPSIGQTSAPCIAESINIDDAGTLHVVGKMWCFADYQSKSELQELKNYGKVIFDYAGSSDDDVTP